MVILIQVLRTLCRTDRSCFISWHSLAAYLRITWDSFPLFYRVLYRSISTPILDLNVTTMNKFFHTEFNICEGDVSFVLEYRSTWLHRLARQAVLCRPLLQPGKLDIMRMSELPVDTVPIHRPQCMSHPCIKNNNEKSHWSRNLRAAVLPVLLPQPLLSMRLLLCSTAPRCFPCDDST